MQPYSRDLRQKVFDAYQRKEGSQRQIAKRFSVSLSFVQNLLQRHREHQTIEPKPHGGGAQAKLTEEQVALIAQFIEDKNDATLVELCTRLKKETGIEVSRATMGRVTQKLNLTRKKRHSILASAAQNGSKNYALSIGKPLET